MTGSDLFQAQCEDDVFVVTLNNQVASMAESAMLSESKVLSTEFS